MTGNNQHEIEDDWIRPLRTIYFDPPEHCIYCPSKLDLGDEHIIPYWMAGGYVIPKGSCKACGKITGKFEGSLSNTTFLNLRKRIKVQSRSAKRDRKNNKEPEKFEIIVMEKGMEVKKLVPADQLPAAFATLVYPRAGILDGRTPWPALQPTDLPTRLLVTNLSRKGKQKNKFHGIIRIPFNPTNLMRLAAKIAHGFMSAKNEFRDFEPLLIGGILTGHYISYFVGCPDEKIKASNEILHDVEIYTSTIRDDNTYEYAITTVQMFSNYGGPTFEIVTGRRKIFDNPSQSTIAHYIPEIYGREGKFESCHVKMVIEEK